MATRRPGPQPVRPEALPPLPERYDRLAEVLSFGQNGRWRRAMVDHVVPGRPGLVLDVASGHGRRRPADRRARTAARVVGVDLTEAMLRQGQRNVAERARPTGSSWWPAGPSSCRSPTPPSTP